jgi:hypothetical protein
MSRMLTGNADVDVPGRRRGPAGEKQMVASQAEGQSLIFKW